MRTGDVNLKEHHYCKAVANLSAVLRLLRHLLLEQDV